MGTSNAIHFGTQYGEPTACRAFTCGSSSGPNGAVWAQSWAWGARGDDCLYADAKLGSRVDCPECLKLMPGDPATGPSLLEKALSKAPRKRREPTGEEVDLAVAFYEGKVTSPAAAAAMGVSGPQLALQRMGVALRNAIIAGLVRIEKVKP